MTTRRQFFQYISATGAAFSVSANMVLGEATAFAQEHTPPADGHFHPKGKPPSEHTLEVIRQAKTKLPFSDKKDFEEQKKGFIAPMKEMKIEADAGHVAWDMESFQFLNEDREFDSIHP